MHGEPARVIIENTMRNTMRNTMVIRQLARFAVVGGVTAAANAALFLLARIWCDALTANFLAVVISTVASTELHRRLTFREATASRWRLHLQTAVATLYYAFFGSGALLAWNLVIWHSTVGSSEPLVEAIVSGTVGLLAALLRFVALRSWVFRPVSELRSSELQSLELPSPELQSYDGFGHAVVGGSAEGRGGDQESADRRRTADRR